MGQIIKKLWLLVVGYFTNPIRKLKKQSSKNTARKDAEVNGQFYFKKQILDKLPEYMRYIKRMKKTDPDGYNKYTRLGAVITTDEQRVNRDTLECRLNQIPGFGAVLHDIDAETQTKKNQVLVPFLYFTKQTKPPSNIEPFDGLVFEVMLFITNIHKKLQSISTPMHVGVTPNGDVKALMYKEELTHTIHHKDKRGGKTVHNAGHRWKHHKWVEDSTPDDDRNWGELDTPDKRAKHYLFYLINAYTTGSSGIRVAAKKARLTAVFTIDMLRTPYFFKDREAVFDPITNIKKKIFHIVRTHERKLRTGSIFVKTHFRGLRNFMWNDYAVSVTMPGWDHRDIVDFTGGAAVFDADEDVPETGFVTEEAFLNIIEDDMKGLKVSI